jgi:hypothetical protein
LQQRFLRALNDMPCGFRQAFAICRKPLFLRAWRSLLPTEQFYTKVFFSQHSGTSAVCEKSRRFRHGFWRRIQDEGDATENP